MKITKILVALSFLFAVSTAHAGEMTVTGSMTATYQCQFHLHQTPTDPHEENSKCLNLIHKSDLHVHSSKIESLISGTNCQTMLRMLRQLIVSKIAWIPIGTNLILNLAMKIVLISSDQLPIPTIPEVHVYIVPVTYLDLHI